jgi:hypothetical protein
METGGAAGEHEHDAGEKTCTRVRYCSCIACTAVAALSPSVEHSMLTALKKALTRAYRQLHADHSARCHTHTVLYWL